MSRARHPGRRALGLAALASLLVAAPAAQTPTPQARRPRPADGPGLAAIVVIDQFRADYVSMYGSRWTKGLRRLLDDGAVFPETAYPYAATFTCAGHGTISTGAFPAVHGLSSNDFYDRAARRLIGCAVDGGATSVPFGGRTGRERYSPRSLLVPTFADELRRQAAVPPRVVSVAQKPRSAIALAGRASPTTMAVWEEDDGTWATSTAYTSTPWPDVEAFVRSRPVERAYGQIWTPLIPAEWLRFVDDAAGEGRPAPWGTTFPHALVSTKKVPDNEFVSAWERSPLNDVFLTDLAIHLLRARKLGTGEGTDLLAVSLPVLDHIGHEYGPRSHEIQDVLFRLDVQIGRLIDALDAQVGRRNYVLAFTSDHGVADIPEQRRADGAEAGRISGTAVRTAVNAALERVFGAPGTHAAHVFDQQIALTPGVMDRLRLTPGGFDAVKVAALSIPGIAAVFTADEVVADSPAADPRLAAWRLSYVPGRSGDFMLAVTPGWILRSSSGTTHGSVHAYDQRVPLIFFGGGIRAGMFATPATPADLAPTLAAIAGIDLPRAQGRALGDVTRR